MKKVIYLAIIFMCFLMSSCDSVHSTKTLPYECPNTKWVAEELDMYFTVESKNEKEAGSAARGFLSLNGNTQEYFVVFGHGYDVIIQPIEAYVVETAEDGTKHSYIQGDLYMFKGEGTYNKDSFTLTITESNIDLGDISEITFWKQEL